MSDKKEFCVVGNTFTHLTGGNFGYSVHGKISRNIRWTDQPRDVTFYVDNAMVNAFDDSIERIRYGWLLESRHVTTGLVESIAKDYNQYFEVFENIFTHDQELLQLDDRFKWVPAQGFWIKEPRVYDKSKLVSMISSNKNMFSGHIERLVWVEMLKDKVDLYGRGFREIQDKEEGLCDYMFSVAIENGSYRTYFTEKLLDCFATGTIPIYLGAPDVADYFIADGIIDINDFDSISEDMYRSKIDAVTENLERAKKMEVLEDFIYENYLS